MLHDEKHISAPLPTSPQTLMGLLEKLDIDYKLYEHEAVFTVAESRELDLKIPALACRNLFLRDKKKKNFLITVGNDTSVDLKKTQKSLGCGRLSFGSPERLWENLGIRPGSVCPFCAVNDHAHQVQIVLDKAMMQATRVAYHPLDNRMTVSLTPDDLMKFFDHTGHKPVIVDFS